MNDAQRQPVLSVRDLDIDFWVDGTWYPAVVGAKFDLFPGEVLAIVGESGSGKSTTAMAMLGLLPKNASVRGSIKLRGKEIVGIVRVAKEYYPDHTDETGKFGMVDLEAVKPLKTPVTLKAIKEDARLKDFGLVRQGRLSVVAASDAHWALLMKMAGEKA